MGKYSQSVLNPNVGQVDTDAIEALAVTTAKIAADTIKESNLNGVKVTGAVNSVTFTMTHSLGTTPTFTFLTNVDATVTGAVRLLSVDATYAYVAADRDGTDSQAYFLL